MATQFVLILILDMTVRSHLPYFDHRGLTLFHSDWKFSRYSPPLGSHAIHVLLQGKTDRAHLRYRKGTLAFFTFDINFDHTTSYQPEFEVAEQYLNLIYRQFIMYISFPFFPLIGLVSLICNLVEYVQILHSCNMGFYLSCRFSYILDKVILLRICKTPPQLRGSMKHYLIFFLFVSGILSLVLFPYGVGFISYGGLGFDQRCSNGTMLSVGFEASLDFSNTTIY